LVEQRNDSKLANIETKEILPKIQRGEFAGEKAINRWKISKRETCWTQDCEPKPFIIQGSKKTEERGRVGLGEDWPDISKERPKNGLQPRRAC